MSESVSKSLMVLSSLFILLVSLLYIDASVKDMEAAAVAWAAELYSVPYFALKVVTDIGKLEKWSGYYLIRNPLYERERLMVYPFFLCAPSQCYDDDVSRR